MTIPNSLTVSPPRNNHVCFLSLWVILNTFFSSLPSSYNTRCLHCPHSQHLASGFLPLACNFPSLLTTLLHLSSRHQCVFRAHLGATFSMSAHLISSQAGSVWGFLRPSTAHKSATHICLLQSTVGSDMTPSLTVAPPEPNSGLGSEYLLLLLLSCAFLSSHPLSVMYHVILNLEFSRWLQGFLGENP